MVIAIDHPAIACHDVQKQADWYCQTLGMQIVATNEARPPAIVLGFGDTIRSGAMIELMPVKDDGPAPASIERFAPGIRHIAFRVSDFRSAYAKLRELGVIFTTDVGEAVGGGATVLFRDPEGNELQIVQR